MPRGSLVAGGGLDSPHQVGVYAARLRGPLLNRADQVAEAHRLLAAGIPLGGGREKRGCLDQRGAQIGQVARRLVVHQAVRDRRLAGQSHRIGRGLQGLQVGRGRGQTGGRGVAAVARAAAGENQPDENQEARGATHRPDATGLAWVSVLGWIRAERLEGAEDLANPADEQALLVHLDPDARRGGEDHVVAGLHRHLDAGVLPPVEARADASTIPCWGGGSWLPGGTTNPERRTLSWSSSLTTTWSNSGRSWWRTVSSGSRLDRVLML